MAAAQKRLSLHMRSRPFALSVLGGVFVLALIAVGSIYAINAQQEAVRGVRVAEMPISDISYDEAHNRLRERADTFYAQELTFRAGGTTRSSIPSFTGMDMMIAETLDRAYAVGREGSLPYRILQQLRAAVVGIDIPIEITFDEREFDRFVTNTFGPLHTPAQNASYAYNPNAGGFDFVAPQEGTIIDLQKLQEDLRQRARSFSSAEIEVVRVDQQPIVAHIGAEEARAQAEALLERGFRLSAQNDSWRVDKEDIASWIVFEPERIDDETYRLTIAFSDEAISSYLAELAPGLNTPARDAQFRIVDGRVQAFQLERPGYQLRLDESTQAVVAALGSDKSEARLLFDVTEPAITSENIENLNINALLGQGESDFAGSPANRVHNIKVGASKYQGLVLAPGEEFSFNENLGDVDASTGYLPELVIKDNQTVPEYGGGICQVSTTLFRAAVYAGLDIRARQNHSYVVRYYGTPGFDATIYPPFPDMRFVNNTPGHLLIQYRIVGTKLFFEIYGQDDGRNVEVVGPVLYDQQENGAVKAWVKQTVTTKDGAIMEEQTFYSNYRSSENYPVNRNPLE